MKRRWETYYITKLQVFFLFLQTIFSKSGKLCTTSHTYCDIPSLLKGAHKL